jgi:hypothetical protein
MKARDTTESRLPARSLRRRLFWSHLSVAAVGVVLLVPLLGTNVWLGQHIDYLTHREVPAAEGWYSYMPASSVHPRR